MTLDFYDSFDPSDFSDFSLTHRLLKCESPMTTLTYLTFFLLSRQRPAVDTAGRYMAIILKQ